MTAIIRLALAAAIAVPAFAAAHASIEPGYSVIHRDATTVEKRSRPRQKGGSGCDDPNDRIEHPECR